ncbi:3-hydroxyacyl-CoA dehydrogenase family protein [Elioraea sp. Yellowstone]|jgi:3-hydroxybutyryl-CoA dehydrogenase|nr:3-hydroxyacyl-CoA dehydrogenase family protein [Elioraea sp. Yellowstone]
MMRVAVLGAGVMGHALALVHALGGCRVRLTDTHAPTLEVAPALMAQALATLREAGETDRDAAWLASVVTTHTSLAETVADAELIVEAITEDAEAKRALYAALDPHAPRDAILASNTSYLDPFPLMPEGRQHRAAIAHWYTPPYLVDLVDVVGGPRCDAQVPIRLRDLYAGMGKHPIVLRKFVPGYIANRIQAVIAMELYTLLDAGVADAAEIDAAIVHGLSLRLPLLGHFMKADFTGLPLVQKALAARMVPPPPPITRSAALDRLIAEGATGVMAGRGFYDYGGAEPARLFGERDRRLIALKRALKEIGSMIR